MSYNTLGNILKLHRWGGGEEGWEGGFVNITAPNYKRSK